MAKIVDKVEFLSIKRLASGRYGYYWQPSATLKKRGWKPFALGTADSDRDPALIKAAKAQNAKVGEWKEGGAKPRAVKAFVKRASTRAMIEAYREHIEERVKQYELPASERNPTLGEPISPNTKRNYFTSLNILETWAGDVGAHLITPERVAKLRDALMMAKKGEKPQHYRAHNALRVGRQLFAFGEKQQMIARGTNPFENFDLSTPAPRDAIWDEAGGTADLDAFARGADAIGFPSLALAVAIAEYTGQREADLLKLTELDWKDITKQIGPDVARQLAEPGGDGRVWGIALRQNKTRRWVGVPITGDLRRRVEAAIAANRKRGLVPAPILLCETTGERWRLRNFIRRFGEARAWAIDPPEKARAMGVLPHPPLADLQFRDLRRTCVVRNGEHGLTDEQIGSITGHSPRTIKQMLEIYMPRTTNQAAIAILTRHGATKAAGQGGEEKRA